MWNCQHVRLKQPPSPSPKPARSIWHHTRAHTYKHCMRQHLGQVSSSYVPDGVSPSIMLAPSISLSLSIFTSSLLFFAFVGAERDAAAHTWCPCICRFIINNDIYATASAISVTNKKEKDLNSEHLLLLFPVQMYSFIIFFYKEDRQYCYDWCNILTVIHSHVRVPRGGMARAVGDCGNVGSMYYRGDLSEVLQRDPGFVLVTFCWAGLRCKEPPDSREHLLRWGPWWCGTVACRELRASDEWGYRLMSERRPNRKGAGGKAGEGLEQEQQKIKKFSQQFVV